MLGENQLNEKERMVHIRLPYDIHQKVRVKCALDEISMQDYVSCLITKDLKSFDLESIKKINED